MICVLLSTYNGEKYLKEQLESLQKQKEVELKIFVRDDGSNDATHEILDEWQKNNKLTWYKGENIGFARSFIDLLKNAPDADYYAFCDQDDIWLPEKLETAIKKMELLPSGPQLYCSNLFIYRDGKNEGVWWKNKPVINLFRGLVQNVATGCTIVCNTLLRDIVVQNLPLSVKYHDFWLYHTALLFGNIYFDENAYIYYRQHKKNIIGAKSRKIDRLQSRIKSLKSIKQQNYREYEAVQLLNVYGNLISFEQRRIIERVVNYKKTLRNRLALLFSRKYVMHNFVDTFWLKMRIIIGHI